MVSKSQLSLSAQELIARCSDAEFEQMRSCLASEAIQAAMAEGLLEREAIWLLSWEASVPEVTPDDPIYNDQSFNLCYQMPSGRMQPLEFTLPPTASPDSAPPPDPTP